MELKKQNRLTKLKKINIVDSEKNTAKTMGWCPCTCFCLQETFNSSHGEFFDRAYNA